jgi:hypothetical protein
MPPKPFSVLKRYLPAIIFLLVAAVLITWLGCKRAPEGETTNKSAPKSRTERSKPRPRAVADTQTPAAQEENTGAPAVTGGYRMQIVQIWNYPRELPAGGFPPTAQPCGWKELQQPGKQGWYRLFVQTKIVNDAKIEPDSLFLDATLTFSAQGRYASVPCKDNQDMVEPPAEETVGNGINSWSVWHERTMVANVHCDAKSGVITTRMSRSRANAQATAPFHDGFRLTLELKEGDGGMVICRAHAIHPLVEMDDTAAAAARKTSASAVRFLSAQPPSR